MSHTRTTQGLVVQSQDRFLSARHSNRLKREGCGSNEEGRGGGGAREANEEGEGGGGHVKQSVTVAGLLSAVPRSGRVLSSAARARISITANHGQDPRILILSPNSQGQSTPKSLRQPCGIPVG